MRSRASNAPAIATIRIEMTPSRRSINTDATASTPLTPSFDSPYARTASPPTLAGRNVPTNVLTKKIRMTVQRAAGGRPEGRHYVGSRDRSALLRFSADLQVGLHRAARAASTSGTPSTRDRPRPARTRAE